MQRSHNSLNNNQKLINSEKSFLKKSVPKNKNKGFKPVLTNTRFLVLWLGQVFSQLADKIYLVLMIAIIASNFQKEGQTISGWVSAIIVSFTIPAVLFGSLAGVYVDRWSKKSAS